VTDGAAAHEVRAAGAVVWRPADSAAGLAGPGRVQVALIHRPKYDDWSFAKGKLEAGEHVLRGCVREVFEETGLTVTLGRRLHSVRYGYRDARHAPAASASKRVDYWAGRPVDASLPFAANTEVDRLEWLSVGEARTRLSYAHDVELLDEFGAGPIRTVPLIWLRHASAGSRSDWPGPDVSRPLDATGNRAARELAGLLRCFGTMRVISSPTERCLATVRPYAEAVGVPVEAEPALLPPGVDASPGHDEAAAVAAALASAAEPVVACAHRENLPALIGAACDLLGGAAPAGPPLRKSEFLVLHTAAGKLAAAERHQAGAAGLAARPRRRRRETKPASVAAG
jgi:8-oxo-(d)GTP phosphatase